jgi:hypothetical protein
MPVDYRFRSLCRFLAGSAFDRDLFSRADLRAAARISHFHKPSFYFKDHVVANQQMSKALIDSVLEHPGHVTRVELDRIVMEKRMIHGNVTGVPLFAQTSSSGTNLYELNLLDELLISPAILHSQVRVRVLPSLENPLHWPFTHILLALLSFVLHPHSVYSLDPHPQHWANLCVVRLMLQIVLKGHNRVREFERALTGVTKSVDNGSICTSFTELRRIVNQLDEIFPPTDLAETLRQRGLPLPLQWSFRLVDLFNQATGSSKSRRETGGLFFLVVSRMLWMVIHVLSGLSTVPTDKVHFQFISVIHSFLCPAVSHSFFVYIFMLQDETACLHGLTLGQNAPSFLEHMLFKEHFLDFAWPLVSEASGESWLRHHKDYTQAVRVASSLYL